MRRRDFIAGIAGSAAAWPLAARAQRESVRRIGALIALAENDAEGQAQIAAFREGLLKFGWADGRNIQIDIRRATGGDASLRQRFAEELVGVHPDLILPQSSANTAALLQQTRTIPIVFVQVADPIGSGFVTSFPRPGGNATGFTTFEPTIAGKWVELLKEIAPRVNRIVFLFNPATTATFAEIYLSPFRAAAASFAVEAITAPVRNMSDVESVVAGHARVANSGLMVMPDPFFAAHSVEVTALTVRHRLPTIAPYRYYAERGGLLSYGNDVTDNLRRAAAYADRILKGEKPNELPVQAPVKYELVINMKTAKALGLDVPLHLQQRADEVVE